MSNGEVRIYIECVGSGSYPGKNRPKESQCLLYELCPLYHAVCKTHCFEYDKNFIALGTKYIVHINMCVGT